MQPDGIPPHFPDARTYSDGFNDGLKAQRQLGHNLELLSLANALDTLALHAATMDNRDEDHHDGCLDCQAMILLGRVVKFGDRLRDAEHEREARK